MSDIHTSDSDSDSDSETAAFITKTPLLNRAKVKALALACAQQRARKFSRVGNEFYVGAEAALRNYINQRVANHPSIGVTLR